MVDSDSVQLGVQKCGWFVMKYDLGPAFVWLIPWHHFVLASSSVQSVARIVIAVLLPYIEQTGRIAFSFSEKVDCRLASAHRFTATVPGVIKMKESIHWLRTRRWTRWTTARTENARNHSQGTTQHKSE
jgi:hypothetical protein